MKYTISLPDKIEEVINTISGIEQISKAEVMRKALISYFVFWKNVQMGKSICIVDNGVIEKEIIISL